MLQLRILTSIIAFYGVAYGAESPPGCKNVPGGPGWPSDSDWARLNAAVGGNILKPPAPAAGCHQNSAAQSCLSVRNGWHTAEFHVSHPTSVIWQNWSNYSCSVDARATCRTTGYPLYVVAATEWSHVKAAVDFARTKNIRLNIKATGHDFLGRSIQPYSLSIWTHRLRGMRWYDTSFTPTGCNRVINGPFVTVAAGHVWSDVYSAASRKGLSVVGGYTGTVGIAGHISNGGHGKLSAKYGYAADMVAQIQLVTADGRIITANECQNQDYFWAMRGGGGSTYGVALTYTIQAIRGSRIAKFTGFANGWSRITRIHAQWPRLARVGAGGYITGYPGRGGRVSVSVYLPNSTVERLRALVAPILAGRMAVGDYPVGGINATDENLPEMEGNFTEYSSLEEALKAIEAERSAVRRSIMGDMSTMSEAAEMAESPGTGANKIIASWLWSAKDVANPKLGQALRGSLDRDTQMVTDAVMGVGTANPPFIRGGGNAVNPALRSAIMRPAAELHWEGSDLRVLQARLRDAVRLGASLRSLNPSGGTYASEAGPDTPNWTHAFWGANYPKLLSIKKKVDPDGVFYCRVCVGSELFEDRAGRLCRKDIG